MSLRNICIILMLTILAPAITLDHSGDIIGVESWNATDNPHYITGDLDITNGATLTIGAGCNVYVHDDVDITIHGVLNCSGLPSSNILITSSHHNLSPQPGDWGNLYFVNPDDDCVLAYTNFMYGGGEGQMVHLSSCLDKVSFNHCQFSLSDDVAVRCESAADNPNLSDCVFSANGGYPIRVGGRFVDQVMAGAAFSGNNVQALYVYGDTYVDGDWPGWNGEYHIYGDLDSPNGAVWNVGHGAELMFASGTRASIKGGFSAIGTPSDHVVFTCLAGSPYPGAWRGLYFSTLEGTVPMSYCDITYAGGSDHPASMWFSSTGGDVTLDHCLIRYGDADAINCSDQAFTLGIANTRITDNEGYPIKCGAATVGRFGGGNNFTGNDNDNIYLNGGQTGDATWLHIAGSDYEIDGWPKVLDGCVLNIEAGVDLLFHNDRGFEVNGAMRALGAPGSPITFTTIDPTPAQGSWRSVYFNQADSSRFAYCNFSYGGGGTGSYSYDRGIVNTSNSGSLYFENCSISHSGYHGMRVMSNNDIHLTDCSITHCAQNGLNTESDNAVLTIDNCYIADCGGYPAVVYADNLNNIANCTFGANGIQRIRVNGGWSGDCTMHYMNMPYEIGGNINVGDNNTLTIEPGVDLLFDSGTGIDVLGAIVAQGTQAAPITFTSSAATPYPGAWNRLYINTSDQTNLFDWCVFEYGGKDVTGGYSDERAPMCIYRSQDVTFNNCLFTHSANYGVRLFYNTSPIFNGCEFSNNGDTAVSVENGSSFPEINNCTINNNAGYPVSLYADAVDGLHSFSATGNDIQRIFVNSDDIHTSQWRNHGMPYEISGDVHVFSDHVMTIDPGVEMKFLSNGGIMAHGGIVANGTETANIIFTSISETPAPGAWRRIYLDQVDDPCSFSWCVFEYGGQDISGTYSDERAPMCVSNSPGATFDHCMFSHSAYHGVRLFSNSTNTFNSCTFAGNGENGVSVESASGNPHIVDCDFNFNAGYPMVTYAAAANNLMSMSIASNGIDRIKLLGDLVYNHTWRNHEAPYEIAGNVNVGSGATLTIDPGVELLFNPGVGMEAQGGVVALGTEESPIKFSGSVETLYAGCWESLYLNCGNDSCRFAWCDFEYGGADMTYTPSNERCLVAFYSVSDISFDHCTFTHSAFHGVRQHSNTSVVYTDCEWSDNGENGLNCESISASPQVVGCSFDNNAGIPLKLHAKQLGSVQAFIASGNGDEVIELTGGLIETLTMHNFGMPYRIVDSDILVGSGSTLTIDPGVELRLDAMRSIEVQGGIQALGSQAQPITITGVQQTPGFWLCIYLNTTSQPCHFQWCDFAYGGADVTYSPTNERTLVSMYRTSPTFTDCNFTQSQHWGARVFYDSSPQFVRCAITGNAGGGVEVNSGTVSFGASLAEWNDLDGNGGYALYNNTSSDIDAEWIWWGDTSADSIAAWIWDGEDLAGRGEVDFEPWTDEAHLNEYVLFMAAPQNLRITIENNQVNLDWDEVADATVYRVYSADDPQSTAWTLEANDLTATAWSGNVPTAKRYYRVTADN